MLEYKIFIPLIIFFIGVFLHEISHLLIGLLNGGSISEINFCGLTYRRDENKTKLNISITAIGGSVRVIFPDGISSKKLCSYYYAGGALNILLVFGGFFISDSEISDSVILVNTILAILTLFPFRSIQNDGYHAWKLIKNPSLELLITLVSKRLIGKMCPKTFDSIEQCITLLETEQKILEPQDLILIFTYFNYYEIKFAPINTFSKRINNIFKKYSVYSNRYKNKLLWQYVLAEIATHNTIINNSESPKNLNFNTNNLHYFIKARINFLADITSETKLELYIHSLNKMKLNHESVMYISEKNYATYFAKVHSDHI